MENNNIYKAQDKALKKLQNIPNEYGVLMYMILKQELSNNKEIREELKDSKNNYLLINAIVDHLIVASSDFNVIMSDINPIVILQTFRIYFLALTETDSDGIGLNEEDSFEKNFSILLYNSIYHRIIEMPQLLKQCKTDKEIYQLAFNTIRSFTDRIKTNDKDFSQFILEYEIALQDYDLYINYGLDFDDEDDFDIEDVERPDENENYFNFDEGDFFN